MAETSRALQLVTRLLEALGIKRFEIGRLGDVYLTRWVLLGTRGGPGRKLFLHYFRRSDYAGALHDHPWDFTSLVLWPGYYEHTDRPGRVWYGPLSILPRPAAWAHRVEILEGRGCWTLVLTGHKWRSWGFWCPGGFKPWKAFDRLEQQGLDGCDELELLD